MYESNDVATLKELLHSIAKLTYETRQQRTEVVVLSQEIEQKHDDGQLTDLHYAVDVERLRRMHQNIDYCLRSLDRQKKIVLTKLSQLS